MFPLIFCDEFGIAGQKSYVTTSRRISTTHSTKSTELLGDAAERAKANNRKTIQPRGL
jgi:hypothetical protein